MLCVTGGAVGVDGTGPRERDLMLQAGKAALAACVPWAMAGWWLQPAPPKSP
ncbi:hypothetical protein [Streptomyces sp. NPDC054837]